MHILQSSALVALRKESVDRNIVCIMIDTAQKVALRKESVDRNKALLTFTHDRAEVALRKESVDRNTPDIMISVYSATKSLSARRAWIEIWKRSWCGLR